MPYKRKTEDEYYLEGLYENGWEELTTETNVKQIRERKKEYQENQPQHQYRWKKRRISVKS